MKRTTKFNWYPPDRWTKFTQSAVDSLIGQRTALGIFGERYQAVVTGGELKDNGEYIELELQWGN